MRGVACRQQTMSEMTDVKPEAMVGGEQVVSGEAVAGGEEVAESSEPKRESQIFTANTKTAVAEDMYNLQIINTANSGRFEFAFPDNANITDVKQCVYDEWPEAFGEIVQSVDWIGILHHGAFLKPDILLSDTKARLGKTTFIHLVSRAPPKVVDGGSKASPKIKKKSPVGTGAGGAANSAAGCCTIS